MTVISTSLGVIMALIVLAIRLSRAKKPTSFKQIILPPLFMSTGFTMFLYPPMHVHMLYAIESLISGMLLSIPLILTSKLEIKGTEIFLKRSKAFIFILLGLLLIRLVLKAFVGEFISFYETGGLFYILAVGMIFPWRIAMAIKYRQLSRSIQNGTLSI